MTPAELELIIDRATQDRSTHLDLYQKSITSLPDSIGNLTDLVSLRLTGNRLTTIPASIGNLTNLRELRLYKNQLKTLPDSIANLQNLTWLSLSLNRLTVFPESITELTNLTGLLLNGNQMVVLPQSITKLTNLTYLDITGNPLMDLSVLNSLPKLKTVKFWGVNLPCKYWSDTKSFSSALQSINGNIVECQITSENLRLLGKRSLIWLPSNLDRYLPAEAKKDENIDSPPEALSFMAKAAKQMFGELLKNLEKKAPEYHLHLSGNKLTSLPSDIGKLTKLTCIELSSNKLTSLPASIGNLNNLIHLDLRGNQLSFLPNSIDNLTNLTHLYLGGNLFDSLPDAIVEMSTLTHLHLNSNSLTSLPENLTNLFQLIELNLSSNNLNSLPLQLDKLTKLKKLDLSHNKLTELPSNVGDLTELVNLNLSGNQLTSLPSSMRFMIELTSLDLSENPLADLSILQHLPKLQSIHFLGLYLPRRYWTKLSEWKAEWLQDETNAELRRRLIQQIGYERICQELDAIQLDSWREYTLLKIDGIERWHGHIDIYESMVLLKMTCPSTGHIHVLRVPPEMTSAEAAITWVNHGIHPDKFIVQT
ncbi:leucine-rich repeat domain-containing protein [Chamaesiphon minutus]|uniref:Leucine Rich Repeat (LRR)-containing protein n=1 Tax=Chamaesiphon minutus (strain ATCC 27169 / PCC 6605) TaxID=1173020 RepID=K9UBM3_CHAP6|nr:leucine-rich repeat domain-containing protein [Chamaesiphon minutus]AFY92033.1 Leucine Rich Repeat (LRR)-containing protein [Chamaesiphon minutus PCC 6605]